MRTKWGNPANKNLQNTVQEYGNSEIYAWIIIVQLG